MSDNVVPIRPGMPARPVPDLEVMVEDLAVARGMIGEALAHATEGSDETLTATIRAAWGHTDLAWTMAGGRE